ATRPQGEERLAECPPDAAFITGTLIIVRACRARFAFAQAVRCRRRHQASRPPLAKIRPGSPVHVPESSSLSTVRIIRPRTAMRQRARPRWLPSPRAGGGSNRNRLPGEALSKAEPPSAHPPDEGNGFPEPRPYRLLRAGILVCEDERRQW